MLQTLYYYISFQKSNRKILRGKIFRIKLQKKVGPVSENYFASTQSSLTIAIPAGGAKGAIHFKFQNFGQYQTFSVSDRKNLGEIRNLKAVTRNCCAKKFFVP